MPSERNAKNGDSMAFEDRVKYMERGSGQVFYHWRNEDSNDWAVGIFASGRAGVQTVRRFESESSAEEFLAELQCTPF
jgi:hypothetical protein